MKEKVVMITGAAAGIGLACAEAFAKAGATTILVDINKPEPQTRKLTDEGFKAVAYGCDVSDTQAVKEMVDWIVATYGHLDAALNNAGIQTLSLRSMITVDAESSSLAPETLSFRICGRT